MAESALQRPRGWHAATAWMWHNKEGLYTRIIHQTQDAENNAIDVQPQIVKSIHPKYPEEARKSGLEATVWVKMLVDVNGNVKDAQLLQVKNTCKADVNGVRSPVEVDGQMFSYAALEAARKWQYKPAEKNGKPVEMWVSMNFKLN